MSGLSWLLVRDFWDWFLDAQEDDVNIKGRSDLTLILGVSDDCLYLSIAAVYFFQCTFKSYAFV